MSRELITIMAGIQLFSKNKKYGSGRKQVYKKKEQGKCEHEDKYNKF
jgi:hypothetical protein